MLKDREDCWRAEAATLYESRQCVPAEGRKSLVHSPRVQQVLHLHISCCIDETKQKGFFIMLMCLWCQSIFLKMLTYIIRSFQQYSTQRNPQVYIG